MTDQSSSPEWTCNAGTIQGWSDGSVFRATGIRYAHAARGRAPVAEPPAPQLIQATAWAPACPQSPELLMATLLHNPMGTLPFDEHCQRLSITIPVNILPDETLPVMVWIHGGSYTAGAGDAPIFDFSPLVQEQRVVAVAITYRLGLFGFLGQTGGTPPNLGLLDLIEALRWIKRNIAAFGGAVQNLTLFGESAGGDAIAHLMISKGTVGLFHRAIIQSAPLGISRNRAKMAEAMAEEASLISPDASAAEVVKAKALVSAKARTFGLNASMPFSTQYGFDPLPREQDVDSAWKEAAPRVQVMIGNTAREAALFVETMPKLEKFIQMPVLGGLVRNLLIRAITRKVYSAGADAFASRQKSGGGSGYRYTLTWSIPGNPFAAAHTTDLPLLFCNPSVYKDAPLVAGATWPEIEQRGAELRAIWAEFARTGSLKETSRPGLIAISAI